MLRVGKLILGIFGQEFEFKDAFMLTTLDVGLFCGINGIGSIGKSFKVGPRNVG